MLPVQCKEHDFKSALLNPQKEQLEKQLKELKELVFQLSGSIKHPVAPVRQEILPFPLHQRRENNLFL